MNAIAAIDARRSQAWRAYLVLGTGVLCITWSAILVKFADDVSGPASAFYRVLIAWALVGLWLLVRELTGSSLAGVLAGSVFAFNEFFTFDNTERSVFALLLVLLVLVNHLIPAFTPLSRVCLELVSAVKQRPRALAEKRYTREQGL